MNITVRTPVVDDSGFEAPDALGVSGAEALVHLDSLAVPGTVISYPECERLRQSIVCWLCVLALAAEVVAVAWLTLGEG